MTPAPERPLSKADASYRWGINLKRQQISPLGKGSFTGVALMRLSGISKPQETRYAFMLRLAKPHTSILLRVKPCTTSTSHTETRQPISRILLDSSVFQAQNKIRTKLTCQFGTQLGGGVISQAVLLYLSDPSHAYIFSHSAAAVGLCQTYLVPLPLYLPTLPKSRRIKQNSASSCKTSLSAVFSLSQA